MVAALATSAFVGQRVVVAPVVKVRSPPYPLPAMFVRDSAPHGIAPRPHARPDIRVCPVRVTAGRLARLDGTRERDARLGPGIARLAPGPLRSAVPSVDAAKPTSVTWQPSGGSSVREFEKRSRKRRASLARKRPAILGTGRRGFRRRLHVRLAGSIDQPTNTRVLKRNV